MVNMKLGIASLVIAGLCTGLLAESNPFESKSDKELIDMAGKVVPNQVPDYKMELYKRTKKMKPEQRKKFYEKVMASADKNTANMTMEDFGKRMEAIHAAMKARIAKMTRAQFKASGLFWDRGPHGPGCPCDHGPHGDHKPPHPHD